MENDRVADSEETDPDAGKVLEVPDPDTSRVVAPELFDPERRAQHRRWVLDRWSAGSRRTRTTEAVPTLEIGDLSRIPLAPGSSVPVRWAGRVSRR
jgi:hypothetical protein